ncbi:Hypothetical predicted protein [Marmota monax]|uniref:Uncharacterized protein n=1 Tax=Marmota monax TaxID=9995 RepID=A0A5E4AGW7_MARMO|nr:hypothetical protein GHT09_017109 [Marmota monax]VTJ56029.1 Hypothetical predicted protein [Marmota monax]
MVFTHLKGLSTELKMKSDMNVKVVFILQPGEILQNVQVVAGYLLQDVAVYLLLVDPIRWPGSVLLIVQFSPSAGICLHLQHPRWWASSDSAIRTLPHRPRVGSLHLGVPALAPHFVPGKQPSLKPSSWDSGFMTLCSRALRQLSYMRATGLVSACSCISSSR